MSPDLVMLIVGIILGASIASMVTYVVMEYRRRRAENEAEYIISGERAYQSLIPFFGKDNY